MKEFVIAANDAGQRLDKFISKAVPALPQALLYKYIRTKRIKVNGKRGDIAQRLAAGDTVALWISDEFFAPVEKRYDFLSASRQLSVVYEDENLLLLDKKVGLLCHPDDHEFGDTLIARVQRYLYEKGEYDPAAEASFAPALVNRIDRNTGGLVIAAKNAESLRILNQKLKDREIEKYYLCVVHGTLPAQQGVLTGWLTKDAEKNKVTVFDRRLPGAKEIRTKYRVLETRGALSLVEVELLTGRTHQIRAHFASIGHPLLGDGKYGTNRQNKAFGYKKQFLYSYRLRFAFTTDAGPLNALNGRSFAVDDVWFAREFRSGALDPPAKSRKF
ncbi:MAG: RluA family pseudouridine synthase [Clostridia bacterium]|nr:RluA family pseudouridine synthase [Clostridia bacterium]